MHGCAAVGGSGAGGGVPVVECAGGAAEGEGEGCCGEEEGGEVGFHESGGFGGEGGGGVEGGEHLEEGGLEGGLGGEEVWGDDGGFIT